MTSKIIATLVAVIGLGAAVVAVGSRSDEAHAALPGSRAVTLNYDASAAEVVADFETTTTGDQFVSVQGQVQFPGGGTDAWGEEPMSPDPTGQAARGTQFDPPGTLYTVNVVFYDGTGTPVSTHFASAAKP